MFDLRIELAPPAVMPRTRTHAMIPRRRMILCLRVYSSRHACSYRAYRHARYLADFIFTEPDIRLPPRHARLPPTARGGCAPVARRRRCLPFDAVFDA